MLNVFVAAAVTVGAPTFADAPERLLSKRGVELRADERVFALFAALNAAGYAAESAREGPPLRAPRYHPIRSSVRSSLLGYEDRPALKAMASLFAKNPVEIDVYLEAVLRPDGGSKAARKLRGPLIRALKAFMDDPRLRALFEDRLSAQRDLAVAYMTSIDKDLEHAVNAIKEGGYRAPSSLIVVPNPLDAHDTARRIDGGGTTWLVIGPDLDLGRRAIVSEVVRPLLERHARQHYQRARHFKDAWTRLRRAQRVGLPREGALYLADAVSRGLAFRACAKSDRTASRRADDAFVEDETRRGYRWARGGLRVLDRLRGRSLSRGFAAAVAVVAP